MENLIHYVWKYRLYDLQTLIMSDGTQFEVIDTGLLNTDSGPDFFNAKIKVKNAVLVGNVEIHTNSSDWYRHRHNSDKLYNSVILHVVENIDEPEILDQAKRKIPQWQITVPERVRENYRFLLESDFSVPCAGFIREIPEIYLNDWKNALLTERLERKTNVLLDLLKVYKNDWNEVFYIALARNFGFGINNDAFERLAKSLPLRIILKNIDSNLRTEALFLGQAGLLAKDETIDDDYYSKLRQEYAFLKKKYRLKPLEAHIFRSLRIRPDNFPHIKIVQLASIIRSIQGLFSRMMEITENAQYNLLFVANPDEYWNTHYRFGNVSPRRSRLLGLSAINIILINTVVPLLFAYGKKNGGEEYIRRAFSLLESLKPESNAVVTLFSRSGMKIENACDTQAVIQLKREYCEKKKCMYCRIGHRLLLKQ
ncbi:MAG: DUF2851 family protein [Dysgonamonadaceae bacterium]|jgi:hypothetical protein|nr:DUF2851 family protein [Dysgonamonadaceae bacterium]